MANRWSARSLLELARSFQSSQPVLAAAELGVFEVLADSAASATELAERLKTDARATECLLNALAAMELLEKREDTFTLSPDTVPLVAGSDETSILPMLKHQANCAHRWDRLVEVVRSGQPAVDSPPTPRSEPELRAFIEAMHVVGREMADGIVAALEPQRFHRALDVGGGSGSYTAALLRAAPTLRATLFDLPPVIEMARQRLERLALLERVDLVAGDFYLDPLPPGQDLVLLSAIVHQNSPEENRRLYRKCLASLEPGGTIVVRDIVMDDAHTAPPGGTLFAINMLVVTEGGGTYSFAEMRRDLEAAGFGDVELLQQGQWMDSLVTARRP